MRFYFLIASLSLILGLNSLYAGDKLIIVSPHRKSLQEEFLPAFKQYYKESFKTDVTVEWIDQGGTSDDIRFVKSKFVSGKNKSSDIDVFWGGGTSTFVELESENLLEKYQLPKDLDKELPAEAAGVPMRSKGQFWYASALSSFGIFFNKQVISVEKLPTPLLWEDLGNQKYRNLLSLADPRRSGTATTMNVIVLQSNGWQKGWELLTKIAGNTRSFTHSSSDPIKAVVSGDAAASMAIDFYAFGKIADLGRDKVDFILPAGQTILDPDPVGILKGAPNRTPAERFVNYILSKDAQKFLVLAMGKAGGPKLSSLGRMAVNTSTYKETDGQRIVDFNPFKQKAYLRIDLSNASKTNPVFNDLFGATLIDVHKELKDAWNAIIKKNAGPDLISEFAAPPIAESELKTLADKWDDEVFRNKKINEWVDASRKKFETVAKKALSK